MPISTIGTAGLETAGVSQAKLATGVAGTGPAFSAYQSSAQSVTSSTFTKILFATEDFDTNSNFASSTFTPTVAGYYQINAAVLPSTATTQTVLSLYKNGTAFKTVSSNSINASGSVSSLIYLNGSTDYVETYASIVGTAPALFAQAQYTWFNGAMVRGA
jgi:hypothetical protein